MAALEAMEEQRAALRARQAEVQRRLRHGNLAPDEQEVLWAQLNEVGQQLEAMAAAVAVAQAELRRDRMHRRELRAPAAGGGSDSGSDASSSGSEGAVVNL